MSHVKLSNVSSKYGAPMGRMGNNADPDWPWRIRLHRVYLDSGGYDNGGAYWGMANPLYRAITDPRDDGDYVELYLRAEDRDCAKAKVRLQYPHARFTR